MRSPDLIASIEMHRKEIERESGLEASRSYSLKRLQEALQKEQETAQQEVGSPVRVATAEALANEIRRVGSLSRGSGSGRSKVAAANGGRPQQQTAAQFPPGPAAPAQVPRQAADGASYRSIFGRQFEPRNRAGWKFGVFDHLDASGAPLAEFYENRLRLAEAYDRIGIHALHIAEHHATPLGMSPSPSVFLAAVAQRTKRLRMGPLVYTLASNHPLRLADEICMLDQLSGGRFELGVGRGVSPIEIEYFGFDPAKSQAMYLEAYQSFSRRCAAARWTSRAATTVQGRSSSTRAAAAAASARLVRPVEPRERGIRRRQPLQRGQQRRAEVGAGNYRPLTAPNGRRRATTRRGFPFIGMARTWSSPHGRRSDEARAARLRALVGRLHLPVAHAGHQAPIYDLHRGFRRGAEEQPGDRRIAGHRARNHRSQAKDAGLNYFLLRFAFGDLTLERVDVFGGSVRKPRPAGTRGDTRVRFLLILFAFFPGQAFAQEWPSRPVKFIVSQAPGTSPDITARYLADRLSKLWNQSVVIENRPGGRTCPARKPQRAPRPTATTSSTPPPPRSSRTGHLQGPSLRPGEGLRAGGDGRQSPMWSRSIHRCPRRRSPS